MKRIGTKKRAKRSNSWQKSEVVSVPKQGDIGTTQQSGTGTEVSKMPRLCSFSF